MSSKKPDRLRDAYHGMGINSTEKKEALTLISILNLSNIGVNR